MEKIKKIIKIILETIYKIINIFKKDKKDI